MMKHSKLPALSLLLALSTITSSYAQQGMVTYEEVTKIELNLPPEMEHMRNQIPDSHTSTRVLFFNESSSLLKNPPPDAAQTESMENIHAQGGMMRFQMKREENETYFNFEENRSIEKRDFMGRTFLISGEASPLLWRLTDERSEFLGYMCQKAIAQRDSTAYEAWFTPEISIPTGPGEGGLPGLILVLNIDDGRQSFVAKELSLETVEKGIIVPPGKGKKVTREEFDAIVAEKMEEMELDSSGNNTIILRMQH